MILEEETFEKFGYYPRDLKPKSGKKILVECDDCGKVQIIRKQFYRALCLSCSLKGKLIGENNPNWKGGQIMRICKNCNSEFTTYPSNIKRGFGSFCSPACQIEWRSKYLKGENHPNWQGGISFLPYCSKFNFSFKEYIRDKFGRVCFLCPTTEMENGRRLSVHHVNYNKDCGCDDDETCQFVPLCISCNSKVNFNCEIWEKKIKQKMQNTLNGWFI